MKGPFNKNLVLATSAAATILFALLAYLSTMRFGIVHGTQSLAPLQVRTSSGVLEILCTLETELKPGHDNALNCSLKPRAEGVQGQPKYPLGVYVSLGGSTDFDIPSGFQSVVFSSSEPKSIRFAITPKHGGKGSLFIATNVNGEQENAGWLLDVAPSFAETAATLLGVVGAMATLLLAVRQLSSSLKTSAQLEELAEKRITEAENKAEQEPAKAKFAWDLARVKLEAYFNRNLSQVNQVFWLAVLVMVVGFCFVLGAIIVSINQPKITPPALVAGVSGIITQFIGATFLVIYRSTMAQANQFMNILERINTVGMAIQVLDSIPESQLELKNSTRAEIVKLLLRANVGTSGAKTIPPPGRR